MTGYRQGYQDMLESYENFDQMRRRAKTEPRPQPCSGVSHPRSHQRKGFFLNQTSDDRAKNRK